MLMRVLISFFFVAACFAPCLSSQNSLTATSAATAGAKPKTPAKPKQDQPQEEKPKPKYLVKVHTLGSPPVKPGGCSPAPLIFPATNADSIVKNLAESDYTFVSLPPDRIAIYYKSRTAAPPSLAAVEADMDKLAVAEFQSAVAISVPHGSASKTLKQLTLPADGSFTANAVSDSCIVLLSKSAIPDPIILAVLSKSIPQLYWRGESTPPTQRLFHLDAPTVAKKLTPPSAADSSSGDSDSTDSSTSKSASAKPAAPTPSKSSSTPGSTAAKNIAASVGSKGGPASTSSTPDNSDSTPDAAAKNPSAASSSDKASVDKAKTAPAPPKPLTMLPVNDTLVYSNEDGSDRGFFERNRLMAVLDLPRPEVLMNIWSMQVSTRDPKTASLEAESADELISHNNDSLENAIEQGWEYLSKELKKPNFFEPAFYSYVTQKFTETQDYIDGSDTNSGTSVSPPVAADRAIGDDLRKRWGWCPANQYCLGFIHAFEPVRPTLTNILLTIMAAKKSQEIADGTIEAMQRGKANSPVANRKTRSKTTSKTESKTGSNSDTATDGVETSQSGIDNRTLNRFDGCIHEEQKRLNTLHEQTPIEDCELNDRMLLLDQIGSHDRGRTGKQSGEALQLQCFQEQADQSFGPASGHESEYADTRVGLLRAAVADFLFNYKWATQYPHDFIPYDLTQSAQELNAEFNPLVLAFNRDVKAFTQNLETELQCKHEANQPSGADLFAWFKKGDETFLNDGMISVRGISGVESVVDTVTQSFFDATNPPNLTDLVKSVSDAENNVPGVLKTNLTANEAATLLGALNSVQPAQAKIGRELKLDITPHALAGASSAELEVKLNADESASPTLFKADKQSEDTLSRVAKHDTNTRVRVESLRLFDVSAFSALLQRPRSKFPIVPPFFEVPYFGSFIGLPLPGARVYHRSTAIVSAIIVPTAADLAFGIEFSSDRVCSGTTNSSQPLSCNRAHSPYDFGGLSLRSFHKAMMQCFASGGTTPYAGKKVEFSSTGVDTDSLCGGLSLVNAEAAQPATAQPSTNGAVPPN
jgi:hypothetical protein